MAVTGRTNLLWIGGFLAVAVGGVLLRPPLPVDETRYLAVAWEMWTRGDLLVPHLNGDPYSHKPPLLFWLINGVWAVFGVSDWAARLIAPAFGLAVLGLTGLLARRLWPARPERSTAAPLVLLAMPAWTLFAGLTFFDLLVGAATLLGLLGIVAARRGRSGGWAVCGLAIGLGLLAKGPVILVHLLPVPLLAPWWASVPPPGGWRRWYGGLGLAVLGGAAIGLTWAVPAALAGGAEYGAELLWGQIAGRLMGEDSGALSESSIHGQPWWFHLAVLPGLLLPWILWPSLWKRAAVRPLLPSDEGLRLCLAWLVPVLLVLSLFSGKQPYYLIPSLPAAALMIAAALDDRPAGWGERLPAALFFALPLAVAVAIALTADQILPDWLSGTNGPALAAAAGIAVMFALWSRRRPAAMAAATLSLVVGLHLALAEPFARSMDLSPLARHVADLQARGLTVANVHKYHGQYQFLGRLRAPLAITWQHAAHDWARAHPDARLIVTHRDLPEGATPEFQQPFRNRILAVWTSEAVLADPRIIVP